MAFTLPPRFYEAPVRVALIGCGGTGSQILPRLAQLHRSMIALGHPHGLQVAVFDDDRVAIHNCVRQNFVEADVGRYKSEVSIYRINVAHGLQWRAATRRFYGKEEWNADVVIGAVDTKASRREIDAYVRRAPRPVIWIDMGNAATTGQMVAGCGGKGSDDHFLPLVTDLFPEIADGQDDDDTPSCSAVASLMRQGLATNLMASTLGFSWLTEVLRHGQIAWSGAFFNLDEGRVNPIPADPAAWEKLGYQRPKPRVAKAKQPLKKAA